MYNLEEIESIWNLCVSNKIQQKKYEWVYVLNLLNKLNQKLNVFEIGAYDGGTTIGLSKFAKKMITVDAIPTPRFQTSFFGDIDYSYIGQNSHSEETVRKVKGYFDFVDVFFIDGDHTSIGVEKDFTLYESLLVKDKSIVIFHDIVDSDHHRMQGCTVSDFWNKIKNNFNYEEVIEPDSIWGGIGIIYY